MRQKNINRQKLVTGIIAGAVFVMLAVGVYSVANNMNKIPDNNNIVDLNETKSQDDGSKAEYVADNNSVSDGNVSDGSVSEGSVSEGSVSGGNAGENDYYDKEEIESIYDEIASAETEAQTNGDTVNVDAPGVKDPLSGYTFSEESSLLWPVSGDVILQYSMDSTVLFKTLGVYKCNPAILISAQTGTAVSVAADGIVSEVKMSEETGTTVVVAVGDGYVTTYGQLDGVVVKAGDKVVAGQLLGTVAKPTAYYVEEGSNLYFSVEKDGEPVNPSDYLDE